jgi:hypothetical protein
MEPSSDPLYLASTAPPAFRMSFDSLSAEIALEILSLAMRTDLQNLSLCSRRLYNLTQPLLYETFQQTGIDAIPNLIRSIIEKPHLAGYIKHLDFTLLTQHEESIDIDVSFISPEDRVFVRSQLRESSLKDFCKTGIYNRIMSSKDNWEALLALLLILCAANLESIIFRCQTYEPKYILDILNLAAHKKQPYFTKLRRVTLMPHPKFAQSLEGNSCFNKLLSHTLRIRHLPELNLKFLFSPCLAEFVTNGSSHTGNQEIFTIKVLSITDSHLTPEFLNNTLSRFDSLTHFKYQHAKTARNACDLVPGMIEQGLFQSRHHLEELVLEESDADDIFHFGNVYRALDHMGDFKKLKVVKVQALRILGLESVGRNKLPPYYTTEQCTAVASCLPSSLEHLKLSDCRPSIYGPISELLLSPKLPPNLKSIEVSFDMPHLSTPHLFGDLTKTCGSS